MAGKDISEMSFDEFFLGKNANPQKDRPKPAEDAPADKPAVEVDGSGFARGRPKLNVRTGQIFLYVPRYEGGKGARYAASVEQDGRTIELGRLKVSPLDAGLSSLPTEFEILPLGISPLGEFVLLIDGKRVYEFFAHGSMMFSEDGMPINRAEDTTVVLYPKGKHLWLVDAKVAASQEIGDLMLDTVEVAKGGYIRVRDRPMPAAKPKEEEKPKAAPKKKVKVTGSIVLPQPESAATVRGPKGPLAIHAGRPDISFNVNGAEPSECTVRVNGDEYPLEGFDASAVPESGHVEIVLLREGKKLASAEYYSIPGFACSYSSKGDIPSSETVTVNVGSERTLSIYDPALAGPYGVGGEEVVLDWNIPVVTYDLGAGEKTFGEAGVSVDDLGDSIVVTVRGAAKKTLFLGSGGKKVNLTPEWEDETIRLDSGAVRQAVFDSPSRSATLYITVNSCPVRRFLTFENSADTTVEFNGAEVVVNVGGVGEHVCRVYNLDKTVDTVTLAQGLNRVPVGPKAVSAEVAEVRAGREIALIPVTIREVPFLLRDQMGDVWLHVSKDKRIPLPDGLLESGKKSPAEVRKWHSQIVRMNPELRNVSAEKLVKVFADFS